MGAPGNGERGEHFEEGGFLERGAFREGGSLEGGGFLNRRFNREWGFQERVGPLQGGGLFKRGSLSENEEFWRKKGVLERRAFWKVIDESQNVSH